MRALAVELFARQLGDGILALARVVVFAVRPLVRRRPGHFCLLREADEGKSWMEKVQRSRGTDGAGGEPELHEPAPTAD